ncbi:MAG: glutamate mutase L [Candidatus Bathyarchaeota archaeon]|nr:MAG: glutamate mutase L [Candidatus Bathyarchaeota archaeon]
MSENIKVILATDCGSTTSKARFFRKVGKEYRFIAAGEAPTTVEAPYENVTLGVSNAIREVEELTGHKILGSKGIISPSKRDNEGVDVYVTTSSAGGGLQMMVTGVMTNMTAESANRAALGAGAIVMDVIAVDDGRQPWDEIERIRFLRPDMILSSGGTDGGTVSHIVKIAEFIRTADPHPRLGTEFKLPIVYSGNKVARPEIKKLLGEKFALTITDNLRPKIEIENTEPARNAIHELFMEHVMSHAPGYDKLMKWTPIPIMPTPAGEGRMFRTYAEGNNVNLVGVGLGGATTNIYSIYDEKFVRSVSANLGMSYSICNVLKETGIKNIIRWLTFKVNETDVLNRLYNKMIRPTTIPQTLEELMIEHAVAREALRLGFQHHKSLARPLVGYFKAGELVLGVQTKVEGISRYATYIDMLKVDVLGGTGGLLSQGPRRVQSMIILMDGFQVEGTTLLFQDSVFMMPHLGVLSTVNPKIALEIFEKDCLVKLGTCIAPREITDQVEEGQKIGTVTLTMPNGETIEEPLIHVTLKRIPLEESAMAKARINPERGFDVGAGSGRVLEKQVHGGVVGIILDARGRPLRLPENDDERRRKLTEWFTELQAYPGYP